MAHTTAEARRANFPGLTINCHNPVFPYFMLPRAPSAGYNSRRKGVRLQRGRVRSRRGQDRWTGKMTNCRGLGCRLRAAAAAPAPERLPRAAPLLVTPRARCDEDDGAALGTAAGSAGSMSRACTWPDDSRVAPPMGRDFSYLLRFALFALSSTFSRELNGMCRGYDGWRR